LIDFDTVYSTRQENIVLVLLLLLLLIFSLSVY